MPEQAMQSIPIPVYRRRRLQAPEVELPPWVRIVSNEAGITGGIRLWDAKLDDMFAAPDWVVRSSPVAARRAGLPARPRPVR